MSYKMREDAAMTFEEIAHACGFSVSYTKDLYKRAMAKIQQRPDSLAKLAELVAFKQAMQKHKSGFIGTEER